MIYQREHYCLIGLDFSLCEMPLVQKACVAVPAASSRLTSAKRQDIRNKELFVI